MIQYAKLSTNQKEYIRRTLHSWLNVAEGGKRSGKNTMNIIAWAGCIDDHPDKLHLAAGVSISATKLNIIDSNGYGLQHVFAGRCEYKQYEGRDALRIIDKRGNEKIVLITGGSDIGSVPKIKGNTYGTVYLTEANECHPDFVRECFTRTLTSHDRKLFMDLNPMPPTHWFYKEILDFYQNASAEGKMKGFNYGHFTVLDNLSITDQQLHDLLLTYDKTSIWYQRDILGLRRTAVGIIYDCWNDDRNLYRDNIAYQYSEMERYIAIDYGTTNPMVFLDCYDDGSTFRIRREYYWDSRKEERQKTDKEYADDLEGFVNGDRNVTLIVDPSALSFITECKARGFRVKKADNAVQDGIRLTSTLMHLGKLVVEESCKNLIRERENYVWDDKAALRGIEQPIKESDHAMDAMRYLCKTVMKNYRIIDDRQGGLNADD